MTISDKYRFFIELPGIGFKQVFPKNGELQWQDKKQREFNVYQRTLETTLIFEDRPSAGIMDFTPLANMEREDLTCHKIRMTVDKYCDCDNTWQQGWWRGFLRLSDGDWNFSTCQVRIKPEPDDKLTCLVEDWENLINLFDYGAPPQTISPFVGAIQKKCCTKTGTNLTGYATQCLTDVATWAVVDHGVCVPAFGAQQTMKTCFAREYVVGGSMPVGDGWIQVEGTNWARPVPTDLVAIYNMFTPEGIQAILQFFGGICTEGSFLYHYQIAGVQDDGSTEFPNAKDLSSVLSGIVSSLPCGLTLVSNFLNINPDGTAPANKYYTQAAIDAHDIRLLDSSDVAVTGESQSATKMETTLKDVLEGLIVMFNLDMTIDGNNLRLEHKSYFTGNPAVFRLNLTEPEFVKWIQDKWQYQYKTENHPKFERFQWAQPTGGDGTEFDGYPISYDNICVNFRREPVEKVFRSEIFMSNIAAIVGDEDYFDSELIVIVSMYGGAMSIKQRLTGSGFALNGAFAFTYLLKNYYDYDRPFREGYINKILTPMYHQQKNRKQVKIAIPFDCDDYQNEFDVRHPVRTQMGWGEIEDARYLEPEQILELTLLHI